MHFKAVKDFSLAKFKIKKGGEKDKDKKAGPPAPAGDNMAAAPADNVLKVDDGAEIVVRPHGPIQELSVEPEIKVEEEEEKEAKPAKLEAQTINTPPAAAAETIKVVEAAAAEPAPIVKEVSIAPPAADLTGKHEEEDSLNKLFSNDEEEENPLSALINSLPDVTTKELMEDLDEIKQIIKEWQKK